MSVCLSVGLLVTFVSPAKTVEPFEMMFGGGLVWAKRIVLDVGPDPPRERDNFWGYPHHSKALEVAVYRAQPAYVDGF